MTAKEISGQLRENHQVFVVMQLGFSDADFTKSAAGKWTPGPQLEHIRRSVKPFVTAFTTTLPTEI